MASCILHGSEWQDRFGEARMGSKLAEQLASSFGQNLLEIDEEPAVMVISANSPPIARNEIWTGEAIVGLNIPYDAKITRSEHVGRPYMAIPRFAKGATVWLYIYDQNDTPLETLRGTKITARFDAVMLRAYANGRQSLYIDLMVMRDEAITHDVLVHTRADDYQRQPETLCALGIPGSEGVLHIRRRSFRPK